MFPFPPRRLLVSQWAVFVVASVFSWQLFRHYLVGDALAQVAIAEHIQRGEWAFVVNGYWSVLASFLLVPFKLLLPVNGIDAFRIMNLLLAAGCVHFFIRILKKHIPQPATVYLFSTAVAALLPFYALYFLTADLLLLFALLLYVYTHSAGRFFRSPFWVAFTGILLFFSKTYGFFFFIIHGISALLLLPKALRGEAVKTFAKGFLPVLAVCGLWVFLLSQRYGHFTLSESARYNAAIAREQPLVHPCDTMGLIAPLPGYRYSAWEDMTRHISLPAIKTGFDVGLVKHNAGTVYRLLNKTPRYGLWLCALLLVLLFVLNRAALREPLWLLFTAIVFAGGYLLFFAEERYLMFSILLLYMANAVMVYRLAGSFHYDFIRIGSGLLLLYSLVRPAVDIYRKTNVEEEEAAYTIAQRFGREKEGQHFAAWQAYQLAPLAGHKQWTDFGGISGYGTDTATLLRDLQKHEIRFLVFPVGTALPEVLRSRYDSTFTTSPKLFTVYLLKK